MAAETARSLSCWFAECLCPALSDLLGLAKKKSCVTDSAGTVMLGSLILRVSGKYLLVYVVSGVVQYSLECNC